MNNRINHINEIILVFGRLGLIAFGGPAAHIAMLEQEIVEKRKWLSRQHFLDLLGITNLIPGPNSTEMVMHCGYEREGVIGLFLAGISFILPGVLITGILAMLYIQYGNLPEISPFIYGIKPAVIAIISSAIFKLGKKALKNWELGVLGLLVILITLFGFSEIYALLLAGLLGGLYFNIKQNRQENANKNLIPFLIIPASSMAIGALSNIKIFFIFLKVGTILFGSGYVLFAYLDAELVQTGYLSYQQLLDAIAVGQFTPGPVLSTSTFIGFQLGGFWGAISATVGIFLPSFLFVWLLNPLLPKLKKIIFFRFFLDAVNIASVGVMVSVLLNMSYYFIFDWRSLVIMIMGMFFVFTFNKLNAMFIVLGGSFLGWILLYL